MIFENNDEGVILMAEYIASNYNKEGIEKYKIDRKKVSISTIFLGGAPGSGKTEFLNTVIKSNDFIVIDIDKYRTLFKGYNGKNSSDYQQNATRVANKIYKYCMQQDIKVLLDGTFSNFNLAKQNINKALKKKRNIGLIFIYQDPIISFLYTKIREEQKLRNVPDTVFVDKYYQSINTVFEILGHYNSNDLSFIIGSKNKGGNWEQRTSIKNKKKFDLFFNVDYNRKVLINDLNNVRNGNIVVKIYEDIKKKLTFK